MLRVVQMSYVSSKAVPTPDGLVALEPLAEGEVVVVFGGRCVDRAQLDLLDRHQQHVALQVDDGLFLVDVDGTGAGDLVRHSCSPSCALRGATTLVAARPIAAGEALTYDYATSHGSPYDEFECACGSPQCRGKITADDWMAPELQLRYRGQFSPYLAGRIAALVATGAERRAFAY